MSVGERAQLDRTPSQMSRSPFAHAMRSDCSPVPSPRTGAAQQWSHRSLASAASSSKSAVLAIPRAQSGIEEILGEGSQARGHISRAALGMSYVSTSDKLVHQVPPASASNLASGGLQHFSIYATEQSADRSREAAGLSALRAEAVPDLGSD